MSEFSVKGAFLNKEGLYEKYNSIIEALDTEIRKTNAVIAGLKRYSGFGIETQAANLKRYSEQISACQNNVRLELNTINKIIDAINSKENDAVVILGGDTENLTLLNYDKIKSYDNNPSDSISAKDLLDILSLLIEPGNIIVDKPNIISRLLPILSPITKFLFLYSGVTYSGVNGGTSSGVSSNDEWLEVKYADDHPGVTAWIGKASAETKNDWGSASVNAYLGKIEADVKLKAGFMQYKDTTEYKNGTWTEKEKLMFLFEEASAGASIAAVAVEAKGSIGSDMLGLDGKAEGTLGSAKVEAKEVFSVGENGVNAYVKGEAMVAAAEGKVSGSVNILGLEITGTLGGYAGAVGVEGKFGLEENKFVFKGGAAALIGGSVGLEVGFNDEGWSNFVDFITFWD